MKSTARLLLFCCLSALFVAMEATVVAGGRARPDMSQVPEVPGLSKRQVKDLREKLAASNATQLTLHNDPAAPLKITEAALKYVKREPAAGASGDDAETFDTYVVSLRMSLMNSSSAEIKGLMFRLGNSSTAFTLYRSGVTVPAGKSEVIAVDWMFVPGDPSSLVVSLEGARFSNGIIWGAYPINPPVPPQARSEPVFVPGPPLPAPRVDPVPSPPPPLYREKSHEPSSIQVSSPQMVDTRPVLLNRPRPGYTEIARKNGVGGAAVLRLLVGSDGEVKQVTVRRGLPDFLTEEAIRSAQQLRFKPAMKSGQPVEYWQMIEVEFNLR